MNWLLGFFKKKKKKDSIISCLTKDETIPWDSPNVIYLAVVVTSDFGEFLENDGAKSPGIAETLLPHPKNEIEESILLLLRFINSKKSWSAMKKKYPDLARFRLYSSVKRWNEPRATPIIGVATKLTLMGRSKWLVVLMLRGCWAFGKRRLARERTVC